MCFRTFLSDRAEKPMTSAARSNEPPCELMNASNSATARSRPITLAHAIRALLRSPLLSMPMPTYAFHTASTACKKVESRANLTRTRLY